MTNHEAARQKADRIVSNILPWRPRFIMYHASPASNAQSIAKYGIQAVLPPHQESPWAPKIPVVYLSNSIAKSKEYAECAYQMGKTPETEWVVFKVEYDEFPEEIYSDLLWGLPGTYYTTVSIPSEYVTLVERFTIQEKQRTGKPVRSIFPRHPHYDDPATPRQRRLIAILCQERGIKEPVEERQMTFGEAGLLIKRLRMMPKIKKQHG